MKTNSDQLHKTSRTHFRFHRRLVLVPICLFVWESPWEPVLYFEFYQWFDPFIHGDITLFMRARLKVVFSWGTASGFPASACLVFWRGAAGAVCCFLLCTAFMLLRFTAAITSCCTLTDEKLHVLFCLSLAPSLSYAHLSGVKKS